MKKYNAITYTGNNCIGANGFVKYRKISDKAKHKKFINGKYPLWKWITFYDKETNEKEIIKNPGAMKPQGETPKRIFS